MPFYVWDFSAEWLAQGHTTGKQPGPDLSSGFLTPKLTHLRLHSSVPCPFLPSSSSLHWAPKHCPTVISGFFSCIFSVNHSFSHSFIQQMFPRYCTGYLGDRDQWKRSLLLRCSQPGSGRQSYNQGLVHKVTCVNMAGQCPELSLRGWRAKKWGRSPHSPN